MIRAVFQRLKNSCDPGQKPPIEIAPPRITAANLEQAHAVLGSKTTPNTLLAELHNALYQDRGEVDSSIAGLEGNALIRSFSESLNNARLVIAKSIDKFAATAVVALGIDRRVSLAQKSLSSIASSLSMFANFDSVRPLLEKLSGAFQKLSPEAS